MKHEVRKLQRVNAGARSSVLGIERRFGADRAEIPLQSRATPASRPLLLPSEPLRGLCRRSLEHQRQAGVALVITLILLSVITFMAVTFLVLSRNEHGSVGGSTDQTMARLMSDTGLEHAKANVIAPMLAYSNEFKFDLMVSRNYVNPAGFDPALMGVVRVTNVNFDYINNASHNPLNQNQWIQNLYNLLYDPRVPVFVSNDFRYYLDLNRNGQFDQSGPVRVTNDLNRVVLDASGNPVTNNFIGDPQWIGVLERPGFPHSPSNRFVGRFAYYVVPESKTLDLNYMHNYANFVNVGMTPAGGDRFIRNMGAGTWELNLAAFLVDLNTNIWDPPTATYRYLPSFPAVKGLPSTGAAFDDAYSLLRYRYSYSGQVGYKNLLPASLLFTNVGAQFRLDGLDGYSDGPLMTGTSLPVEIPATGDNPTLPWAGSDNPTHFFTMQELFDRAKAGFGIQPPALTFAEHLASAGTNNSSYNRYTYYRMLAQLGLESAPETDKLNLNYQNAVNGIVAPNMATNFIPWKPVDFFTNAAARMLANAGYANLVITNNGTLSVHIPVYPTNYYTPSVHRFLQLAANIYDASTTNLLPGLAAQAPLNLPSVFQPTFSASGTNFYITGYRELSDAQILINTFPPFPPPLDLESPFDRGLLAQDGTHVVDGIPLVVGARKGFPNFNEFGLQNNVTVVRRLLFHRTSLNSPVSSTNQAYTFAVSNVFGVEAWNSYSNQFSRPLQIFVQADVTTTVTNESGLINGPNGTFLSNRFSPSIVTNIPVSTWTGSGSADAPSRYAFNVPLLTNFIFMPSLRYLQTAPNRGLFSFGGSDPPNLFITPHVWLNLNTKLRFLLVDSTTRRILDYVNLDSSEQSMNVMEQLAHGAGCDGNFNGSIGSLFCTNRVGDPQASGSGGTAVDNPSVWTYGLIYQMRISQNSIPISPALWNSYKSVPGQQSEEATKFNQRLLNPTDSVLDFAAPFTPFRIIQQYVSWQVNDPLVHYTVPDLTDLMGSTPKINWQDEDPVGKFSPLNGLGGANPINPHFRPWNGNPKVSADTAPPTKINIALKDPLMSRSDNWDFPTNKFPNIGWLGRVHRGTPWQTIYMKSTIDTNAWQKWTGNALVMTNMDGKGTVVADAAATLPSADRAIFDLFTTAFNDNAARGQLSVNQTNLAAWSAVFSGVIALTNTIVNGVSTNAPVIIDPVGLNGTNAPLWRIVNGINSTRATNFNGTFSHMGDVLSVPDLTEKSPYLNPKSAQGLNDEVYERIPQQVLGLLRLDHEPRLVIYSYGQTLKPAEHSLITSGANFGLCTNYQVTAESAARAVVRITGAPTQPKVALENYNTLPPD